MILTLAGKEKKMKANKKLKITIYFQKYSLKFILTLSSLFPSSSLESELIIYIFIANVNVNWTFKFETRKQNYNFYQKEYHHNHKFMSKFLFYIVLTKHFFQIYILQQIDPIFFVHFQCRFFCYNTMK